MMSDNKDNHVATTSKKTRGDAEMDTLKKSRRSRRRRRTGGEFR
jgi:hypothetical protein